MSPPLRTVAATRYVTPLREGGSLPAIVEADDLGTYVLKFRGAGQGPKALVAELVAGELGRALGLPVPEIVLAEVDPVLGRTEPDEEIQALVRASAGLNLALDYLPGAIAFEPPMVTTLGDPRLAAAIVWFDALVSNVDRTPRNTNLLLWHKRLYLIDHGAALFFHHDWTGYLERSRSRFTQVRDHVLLPAAGDLHAVDAELAPRLTEATLRGIASLIPSEWLDAPRDRYVEYLMARLESPRPFVEEATNARAQLV